MRRTNIEIDETLVKEAMKLTNQKTKKAVVNLALKELVSKEKRKNCWNTREKLNGKAISLSRAPAAHDSGGYQRLGGLSERR